MTDTTITRARIIAHLHARLEASPTILAAWLGGSEATGRSDALSDVDLQVMVGDDDVEGAFDLVASVLSELSPVTERHRLPDPTWHGHSQELFALRDASPDHVLDLAVVRHGSPRETRFLEPERHGHARVLFDRTGEIKPVELDRAKHGQRMRARCAAIRSQLALFQPVITRAARRDFGAEAVGFYQAFALRPLVELLRMRHAPALFDYGLRYLDRDLPATARAFVEEHAFPANLDDLERMRREIVERMRLEFEALDSGAWSLDF